jgi:hypothetical protein
MKSPQCPTRRSNQPKVIRQLLEVVSTVLVVSLAVSCGGPVSLPPDPQDFCPLPAATFATWFQSGSVTLNGVVNPANSLNNLSPDCGFYEWSEQMFLWLTSPAPSAYGGGAHIFDSPTFYDVSPPDANGDRTFIAHSPGIIRGFPLRAQKVGVHRLMVVRDRTGRLLDVAPSDPSARPLVRDPAGNLVEIAHARMQAGKAVLLDKEGRTIAAQHAPTITAAANEMVEQNAERTAKGTLEKSAMVRRFVIDKIPIFIDPALAVIDVEQGQAGDDSVLEAQTTANGSLVYYATMVNDVYAYFLTGAKKGAITTSPPNQFPTNQQDLTNTINFAVANGKSSPPFPDPNALAIEVKSSWVLAAGLPNASSYITTTATIPTYDTSNPNLWTPTGQQTVQLALVGMHVVGSTFGHPEMVWATFEHKGNVPLATYSYTSTSGPKQINQDTSGTWLFCANGSNGPFNTPHMAFTGPGGAPANSIQAQPNFTISPSDTLREKPFGVDGTNAFENTEVISMNNHVRGMLVNGDIRANYIMTGATWTPFGSNPGPSNQGVGTNKLSNATMETYVQGSNCFACHQNFSTPAPTNATVQISHIFWQSQDQNGQLQGGLKPLF